MKNKIVFLPGLDGTAELFKFIRPYFEGFYCLFINYPKNSKFKYSEYVEFVIGQIEYDKYHLVAESFSGPIALTLNQEDKKRVLSMVLVATFGQSPRPKYLLKIGTIFSKITPPKFLMNLSLLRNSEREVQDECYDVIKEITDIDLKDRLNEIANYELIDKITDVPCLYLKAKNDLVVGLQSIEFLKDKIENFKVEDIKGSHLILQTNPKDSSDMIKKFLEVIG